MTDDSHLETNVKYVIDSDILIYFLKKNNNVVERFRNAGKDFIYTTIINYTELLFGAFSSARVTANLEKYKAFFKTIKVLSFDLESADHFARIKAELKREGNMIADMDLMIASICRSNNYTLVTNNTKHFTRIKDLRIENWT